MKHSTHWPQTVLGICGWLFAVAVVSVIAAGCNATPTGSTQITSPMFAMPPESAETALFRRMGTEQVERNRIAQAIVSGTTDATLQGHQERQRGSAVASWQSAAVAQQDSLVTADRAETQAQGISQIQESLARGMEDQATTLQRLVESIDKLNKKLDNP